MYRVSLPEEDSLTYNSSPQPFASDSSAFNARRDLKDDVSRRCLLATELVRRVLGELRYCIP